MVINTYPLPIIGETIQYLEGFHYVTALDINMGSYTITLLPSSQDMMKIVTEFSESRYKCLPMRMCALGDILQSQSG